MNQKERLALARWAVERAGRSGADEVAVDVTFSRDVEVKYRNEALEELKESTQSSLSLDVYVNHRYSGHSTNNLRREEVGPFIDEAVAMTRYLSEDLHRALPDPRYYEGRREVDLGLVDPKYEGIEANDRVALCRAIAEVGRARSDKVISCSGEYGDTYSESVKVHSNGFEGERRATVYYAGADTTIDDGAGGRPEDWYYGVTRTRNALPSAEFLAQSAVDRALGKIGQKKIASGAYDMLVENRTCRRLLGALRWPLTAHALQQRQSFLEGKLGEKIASEKLTVIDDPFVTQGLGSRLYDGEGLAARRRVIIDKGVLQAYYVDNYYGRKLGLEPTGGSASNILLEEGERSLNDMLAGMKRGILVTGFLGGNSNDTTGDFSFGIVGMLVEDGRAVQPVNEMNISGNLGDLLGQLVEVGGDPYPYSSWRLPSLLFAGVQFSGL
jgi:PmbA protein